MEGERRNGVVVCERDVRDAKSKSGQQAQEAARGRTFVDDKRQMAANQRR